MDLNSLREKIPYTLYRFSQFLEVLVAIVLIAAIFLSLASLVIGIQDMAAHMDDLDAFQNFLALAFNVVIGIEFLKMLCRHNMSSAVEVLLFAVARKMVIEHTSPLEDLIMVTAIAILFATRKYLFIPGLDDKHPRDRKKKEAQPEQEQSSAGVKLHAPGRTANTGKNRGT